MNLVHLHLALNHLPVLGVVFGCGLLAFALWKNSLELKRLSLTLFVLVALVAIPVYFTGEPSEDSVEPLPGVSKPIIEQHEEAAGLAFAGISALGILSLIGLIVSRQRKVLPRWLVLCPLVLSLVVSGLMLRTANLGGQIRHTEIRSGATVPAPNFKHE